MRSIFFLFSIFVVSAFTEQIQSPSHAISLPAIFTSRIDSIPDYYQRDGSFGGFPRKGSLYCGPVSISNTLLYYGLNGYHGIINRSGDPKKDQYNLIKKLGSSRYVNTGSHGSSPSDMVSGLKLFLSDHGYDSAKIHYYGFRTVPHEFGTGISVPDLNIARKALIENKAVWFNIGWYSFSRSRNEYRRNGGHWVSLVGYGHNGKENDPDVLIIHDPDTRWRFNDYLKLEGIKSGTLTGQIKGLPRDAAGFYRFRSSNGKYGIIGGMVVLEMPKGSKSQVASRKSQVASRKSQVASRKSQVTSHKSQVESRKLQVKRM